MKRSLTIIGAATVAALAVAASAAAGNWNGERTTCTFQPAEGGLIVKHPGPFHARLLEAFGYKCDPFTGPACAAAPNAAGAAVCEAPVPIPESSSPMIRMDGDDTVVMVPDEEILSGDPGTRSLANGWKPAYARVGHTDGGTNVGVYTFSGTPGVATGAFTDDSGSTYDEPQNAYNNPVVS